MSAKKKYREVRRNLHALEQKLKNLELVTQNIQHLHQLEAERARNFSRDLQRIVEAIERIEERSSLLPLKDELITNVGDELRHQCRVPMDWNLDETWNKERTYLTLKRLTFDEVTQDAVRKGVAFRLTHDGKRTDLTLPIEYCISLDALKSLRLQEQIIVDMATSMLRRLLSG